MNDDNFMNFSDNGFSIVLVLTIILLDVSSLKLLFVIAHDEHSKLLGMAMSIIDELRYNPQKMKRSVDTIPKPLVVKIPKLYNFGQYTRKSYHSLRHDKFITI